MRVALTNDDNIFALGLRALYKALQERGHTVDVVAPVLDQSGVGRALTYNTPLRIRPIKEDNFSGIGVYGTPTDCVKLGLAELLEVKPDVFLSGINLGQNIGPDVFYSGTISAAAEAAYNNVPAFAVSSNMIEHTDMLEQARYAVKLLEALPWSELPRDRVMNLNLPNVEPVDYKGLKVCPGCEVNWKHHYEKRENSRSHPYWWFVDSLPVKDDGILSDKVYLKEGWATLTPLHLQYNDDISLNILKQKIEGSF